MELKNAQQQQRVQDNGLPSDSYAFKAPCVAARMTSNQDAMASWRRVAYSFLEDEES